MDGVIRGGPSLPLVTPQPTLKAVGSAIALPWQKNAYTMTVTTVDGKCTNGHNGDRENTTTALTAIT